MGDIQTRPFSKNYSGLVNQSVIAIGITILCVTGQELMKRKRRKGHIEIKDLGSRESWEFGYLYNGRSWARFPSPPSPEGWPLSWVRQILKFPEEKMNELRGVDATLYVRFLRSCFWFSLLHTLTTFPILFPIHVRFSSSDIPTKSMVRASISSLVGTSTGLSLLWIHICLLFWITLTWMGTLLYICNGAFRLRAAHIHKAAAAGNTIDYENNGIPYYPHPHPQYAFIDVPSSIRDNPKKGLRLRTVMVSNIPQAMRDEKTLKEYFEYYLSRKVEKPSMGLTSSTQPGFLNKSFAFLFNRARRLPARLPINPLSAHTSKETATKPNLDTPVIEKVVVARKMTELASLLERREEILRLLETAHIKLANKSLMAVKIAMDRKDARKPLAHSASRALEIARKRRSAAVDVERGESQDVALDEEARMKQLVEVLGPYVEEFGLQRPLTTRSRKAVLKTSKQAFRKLHSSAASESDSSDHSGKHALKALPKSSFPKDKSPPSKTIWEALLSLPRSSLDAYQPLVNLSHLFRGKTVPSIDYYTAKLNLLTSLITENRAKAVADYDPVSTAFVTFKNPSDARRACKYLAVHPNNPLACLVSMAPMYQDLDWIRVMKSSFNAEFVKDWVVNMGVWAFTVFWIFPVSLLVGLVSIQNISLFWPSLKSYLDRHAWQSEVIQSFLPTLLVALLALLIPLILLLIAKKAHTITTLSALHDLIMTRYYKFLIVNVLVLFCVGTAALQSLLQSFKSGAKTRPDILNIVASSFPSAGPFYVGWLIFTTAMHSGFELSLLGLPLIMYPTTSRQVTPRKRTVGVRPRTFNFYYWLPNHLLVIHVLVLFSVLNPFVLPFGTLYFFVQSGVVKNQLIHVYAKHYEGDGRLLLIRIVRYSCDGLILSQAVFLAYMVVLKKSANVGLSAFLILFTAIVKLLLTRMCRAQFERDDIVEAEIYCNRDPTRESIIFEGDTDENAGNAQDSDGLVRKARHYPSILSWRLPEWVNFSYLTMRQRPQNRYRRQPIPFGPHNESFSRLNLTSLDENKTSSLNQNGPSGSVDPAVNEDPRRINNHKSFSPAKPGVNLNLTLDDISGPVVPHSPPIPWDDQANPDLPYDNPYYTRTIDNVLWLPRNPTETPDLDDTLDLRTSLTVEVSAGKLGTWLGLEETESPQEISRISSYVTASPELVPTTASPAVDPSQLPDVDGTEEIELPPVIAQRVQAKEEDVDQTIRPRRGSAYRRKLSTSDKSTITLTPRQELRRPSLLDRPPSSSFRSVSEGRPTRQRSSSIMSVLQLPAPRLYRTRSSDQESGIRPDAHAQAEFVAANGSSSRVSLHPPQLTRAQNLSARQAIFHEVLAEEHDALINRLEEEQAEANKARTTKSWLTSWMFKKPA